MYYIFIISTICSLFVLVLLGYITRYVLFHFHIYSNINNHINSTNSEPARIFLFIKVNLFSFFLIFIFILGIFTINLRASSWPWGAWWCAACRWRCRSDPFFVFMIYLYVLFFCYFLSVILIAFLFLSSFLFLFKCILCYFSLMFFCCIFLLFSLFLYIIMFMYDGALLAVGEVEAILSVAL